MGVLWCATKILEDFRKYKIEQIEALRVVEQQIKNTDTKFESIQTNEETSCCKKKAEYEDREEVVT